MYVLDSTSAQLSIGGVGSTVYPALIRQLHAPLITPLHAIYDQLNIACWSYLLTLSAQLTPLCDFDDQTKETNQIWEVAIKGHADICQKENTNK